MSLHLRRLRDYRGEVLAGRGPTWLNFESAVGIASIDAPDDPDRVRKTADALDVMCQRGELRRIPPEDLLARMFEVVT